MSTLEQVIAATVRDVDHILRVDDPERAAHARDRLPPGFTDQMAAAAAEVERSIGRIYDGTGAIRRNARFGAWPDWLRIGLLDTYVAWSYGRARTCRHAPTPTAPQPVWAGAWKPRHVACWRCMGQLTLPPGSIADRTCDACGHLTDAAAGDPIHPSSASLGAFTWMFGTCVRCTALAAAVGREAS